MADLVNGVSLPFLPIGGVESQTQKPPVSIPGSESFTAIFNKELHNVQFSKHAQNRLESRNITLGADDLMKLNSAMDKAEAKGAKDSLVLLRDMAFIVNVPNRTVITTMTSDSMKEHVFTNIDSAVIAS